MKQTKNVTGLSGSIKLLKREMIVAGSEEEYEEQKRQLLLHIPEDVEIGEAKIYIGAILFIEMKTIS